MENKNSASPVEENTPEVKTTIETAKHLKNPILTESDLQKFASNFSSRGVANKRFNSGIVKFSRIYSLNKPWMKYMLAITLGLVMSIFVVILVEVTGLYTGGFSACFQGVARLVYAAMMRHNSTGSAAYTAQVVYNALFWGLYVCLNVPLTIFAYKKINKSFAKLSIVYLVVLQGMGFVWGIIPGIHTVQVFGDTSTVNGVLNDFHIQSVIFSPNWFPTVSASGAVWDWNNPVNINNTSPDIRTMITNENISKALLLLVYSVVFSLISALCYTMMFIIGGSTAGSDYLTIFWSQEKNKHVGAIFILINSVSMLIGITMGTYGAGALIDSSKYASWQYFFSANLFTSLLWVFLNGFLIDKWFPWHKLIRVEIYSSKANQISSYLKTIKYTHPTTLVDATGGYSGQSTKMLLSVCMVIELPKLIRYVRIVDQKCLISSSYIADIDGEMAMQRQTY